VHIVEHVVHAAKVRPVALGPSGLVVGRDVAVGAQQVGRDVHGAVVGIDVAARDGSVAGDHLLDETVGIEFQVGFRFPELVAADLVVGVARQEILAGGHSRGSEGHQRI